VPRLQLTGFSGKIPRMKIAVKDSPIRTDASKICPVHSSKWQAVAVSIKVFAKTLRIRVSHT
ncbi:MAG: hypothetical protein MK319_03425, partial [Pseudomonadales bacterium]|nr:hypothetical protein [Pseudomonadales bacterium]